MFKIISDEYDTKERRFDLSDEDKHKNSLEYLSIESFHFIVFSDVSKQSRHQISTTQDSEVGNYGSGTEIGRGVKPGLARLHIGHTRQGEGIEMDISLTES